MELKESKPLLTMKMAFFSPKYRVSQFFGFMTENGSVNFNI